ncbi:MAG TPA: hypothetical protein VKB05_12205 [Pyrinomonadaceae bacterium]|nr:hypothetical protein [Pyrinomonadaceae bacterium]
MINDSMTQCRYCSVPVDPAVAQLIAERQEKANQSYSDASFLRTAVVAIYVFIGLSYIPFVSILGIFGAPITFILVLVLLIRWQVKFGRLVTNDADYLKARRSWRLSLVLWLLILVIFIVRFLVYLLLAVATR